MSEPWAFPVEPQDEHNRALLHNVHPPDWVNPEPAPVYNLVVVGAGTAGLIAAAGAAGLGGKVALVERHLMGGDCLNVGCVPSKSLIRPARLAAEMRQARRFGLTPADVPASDFPQIMERLRRIRSEISVHDSAERYRDELSVDVFLGQGRFGGPDTLEVEGHTLRFKKAVIATGARAVRPEEEGFEQTGYLTNETLFNLTRRPEHLIVIGGGPIGCEMAQAFRRLGSKVTLIQKSRFLPREDPEASALLAAVFDREGIAMHLECRVTRAWKTETGTRIECESRGRKKSIDGDAVLVGMGRAPNVAGLNLEAAGVEFDERQGVNVDDFLRTTNRRIFAAGDVCMGWKFTHAADAAARIVIQNALFLGRSKLSRLTMPWCTYTDPEVAHVGLYEHDAESRGIATDTYRVDMPEVDRAQADGEREGFIKVLTAKGKDRILGATLVSAHAGEIISELSTAMKGNVGLKTLARVIHPYPTQAEVVKRVADTYNRSRLTPRVAGLMKWWLARQRGGA